ncbi:MAG: helix-turn-helix domain-containing protein, partial [Burkholderiales bacterium]
TANTSEAISFLATERTDAVILDLAPSDEASKSLLVAQRITEMCPSAVLVFKAAASSCRMKSIVDAMQLGALAVLESPVNVEDLADVLMKPAGLVPQDCSIDGVVRTHICRVLSFCRGNLSETARRLGMTRQGLSAKLDKLNIAIGSFRPAALDDRLVIPPAAARADRTPVAGKAT